MKANVRVEVMLKDGILDPQGKTVEENLPSLGFAGVEHVRIGKHIQMIVQGSTIDDIKQQAEEMTRRFLSNPVIEDATIHVEGAE